MNRRYPPDADFSDVFPTVTEPVLDNILSTYDAEFDRSGDEDKAYRQVTDIVEELGCDLTGKEVEDVIEWWRG